MPNGLFGLAATDKFFSEFQSQVPTITNKQQFDMELNGQGGFDAVRKRPAYLLEDGQTWIAEDVRIIRLTWDTPRPHYPSIIIPMGLVNLNSSDPRQYLRTSSDLDESGKQLIMENDMLFFHNYWHEVSYSALVEYDGDFPFLSVMCLRSSDDPNNV